MMTSNPEERTEEEEKVGHERAESGKIRLEEEEKDPKKIVKGQRRKKKAVRSGRGSCAAGCAL